MHEYLLQLSHQHPCNPIHRRSLGFFISPSENAVAQSETFSHGYLVSERAQRQT